MSFKDITITTLETITAFDVVTGDYLWTLDELQNATIANSEETTEITGKGGRRLAQLKRNKSMTVSGNNGLISSGLLATQTGGEITNKKTKVQWTDYLVVNGNEAETSYKAVGTVGAEIEALYIRNADGTLGDQLTQAASAAAGKFAYTPATKKLTFHTDIANDTEVVVFYKRQLMADVLENNSDVYSGKATLYIDAMAEDKCGNVFHIQFYVPKADFNGEFSIEMGDNQTVHAFEATSLASSCFSTGGKALLWTYTIFGEDTEDVA